MEVPVIARRELIIGGACLAAAAGAAWLKPRREVALLKGAKLADVVPTAFGDWTSQEIGDPYAVNGEQTLAGKLYNEQIVRDYHSASTGQEVMMLLAYGQRQSDELQLHRPEICYPAFGYALVRDEPLSLPLGRGLATIPARQLAAMGQERSENIIYWTRMGELLPQGRKEQRVDRLQIAMQGIIPDGVLCRFSTPGQNPERDWKMIGTFVAELIAAMAPNVRKVLVGTERANLLKSITSPARA